MPACVYLLVTDPMRDGSHGMFCVCVVGGCRRVSNAALLYIWPVFESPHILPV